MQAIAVLALIAIVIIARRQDIERLPVYFPERWLGGICSGIAWHYERSEFFVRLVFIILTILTLGCTIPVYIALWFMLPVRQ
jgi:phage shock protein PspC (stress-responsive transcriptional regulator)